MFAMLLLIRLLTSLVVIMGSYMLTGGMLFFLLAGIVVASAVLAVQYKEHRELGHHPVMYGLVYLFDIVLWPSAIYINIRRAYDRRAN